MAKGSRGGKRTYGTYTEITQISRLTGKLEKVKVYDKPPKGFKTDGTGRRGLDYYNNNKSRFGKERITVAVKSRDYSDYYGKNGKPTNREKLNRIYDRYPLERPFGYGSTTGYEQRKKEDQAMLKDKRFQYLWG